jgi:SagB-type dehydrogenase family enzyme
MLLQLLLLRRNRRGHCNGSSLAKWFLTIELLVARCGVSVEWSYTPSSVLDADGGTPLEWFHESTKLSMQSMNPGENREFSPGDLFVLSRGFRQFEVRERISLPDADSILSPLQEVMQRRRSRRDVAGNFELSELAIILQQAVGATGLGDDSAMNIRHVFRACPSAGGLNSIDIYIICSKVSGLKQGIYHFNILRSELEAVTLCDTKELLSRAFFSQRFCAEAAACFLLTAVFDRLSAKYGETRAYRLALLDAGHACQNLLLSAEQLRLNAVAMQGFCDDVLSRSIGLDSLREVVIHTMLAGRAS